VFLGILVHNTQRPLRRQTAQLRLPEDEVKQLRPQTHQPFLEEGDLKLNERASNRVRRNPRSLSGARSAVAGGLA